MLPGPAAPPSTAQTARREPSISPDFATGDHSLQPISGLSTFPLRTNRSNPAAGLNLGGQLPPVPTARTRARRRPRWYTSRARRPCPPADTTLPLLLVATSSPPDGPGSSANAIPCDASRCVTSVNCPATAVSTRYTRPRLPVAASRLPRSKRERVHHVILQRHQLFRASVRRNPVDLRPLGNQRIGGGGVGRTRLRKRNRYSHRSRHRQWRQSWSRAHRRACLSPTPAAYTLPAPSIASAVISRFAAEYTANGFAPGRPCIEPVDHPAAVTARPQRPIRPHQQAPDVLVGRLERDLRLASTGGHAIHHRRRSRRHINVSTFTRRSRQFQRQFRSLHHIPQIFWLLRRQRRIEDHRCIAGVAPSRYTLPSGEVAAYIAPSAPSRSACTPSSLPAKTLRGLAVRRNPHHHGSAGRGPAHARVRVAGRVCRHRPHVVAAGLVEQGSRRPGFDPAIAADRHSIRRSAFHLVVARGRPQLGPLRARHSRAGPAQRPAHKPQPSAAETRIRIVLSAVYSASPEKRRSPKPRPLSS